MSEQLQQINEVLNRPAYGVKFRHGLTKSQIIDILEIQGYSCYFCDMPAVGTKELFYAPLQIDHDHACCPGNSSCGKCVRGLLCASCNTLLGAVDKFLLFEKLTSAEEYARSARSNREVSLSYEFIQEARRDPLAS